MTQEEKSKAYDGNYKTYTELINRLEGVKDAIKKQNYGIAMDILYKPYPEYQITASPELKESDDEKIRKAIGYAIGQSTHSDGTLINGVSSEEALSWLEKRGEQKTIDEIAEEVCKNKTSAMAFLKSAGIINENGELAEQYRQSEQKTTDKVKPKFKVGDYVVGKYISGYISEVRDDCYLLGYQGFSIDKQDSYHLWTIHDVKNGDILVDEDNNIGLYKEEKDDIYWESYIYLGYDNELHGFNIGGYHNNKNTRPATKEQCDALITKMKESGFIWDASIQCIIKEYSYG